MRLRAAVATAVVALLTGVVPTTARADDEPPVPPPDPPAPALRHFTMAFTGDILPHVPMNEQAWRYGGRVTYDFRPMFADIQPLISSVDLAICHMEAPIAPPGTKLFGSPMFAASPRWADAIKWAGYDRCSTASNHALDRGIPGITATLDAFDAAGLGHSGTARTPEDAIAPILDVNGVKVVHLSYAYGFNNYPKVAVREPWRANRIDPARIIADATDARARGAEFVVVSLHWGIEKRVKPTPEQQQLADTLTKSGVIDLIVGHHAHVMQPIVSMNGHWVVYGLGNILSNQRVATRWPETSEDGEIVTFDVTENPGGGFTVGTPVVHATWVLAGPFVALDVAAHLNDPALSKLVRRLLQRSLDRTRKLLGPYVPA